MMNDEILELLQTIKGNGTFLTSHQTDFVLPGLMIEGIGEIRFPIDPLQIKEIIAGSIQAPYGQGGQTIVNTSVRNVWEIDASKLSFSNPKWHKCTKKMLSHIQVSLGLEQIEIDMHLYKLLIYEQGGFFLAHKDSEKEKGMFGTLIINLPSPHTGGELTVSFDGVKKTVDFSASNSYETSYAAFFADCLHEVLPVKSGYRVCLVYNLVQLSNTHIDLHHSFSNQTKSLTDLLKSKITSFGDKPKAIILGHEYTPTNFSLDTLKQHDKPRVLVLMEAANNAGYYAKLALVTKYKMGEAENDYDYDYRYRDRRDDTGGDTMSEVYEEETYVEHWGGGLLPDLGKLELNEEDIISDIVLGEGEPTEEENGGFTGNAGMTLEFWYHHGAVVIWPTTAHLDFIIDLDIRVKLEWLAYYYADLDVFRPQAVFIIDHFNENDYSDRYDKLDFDIVVKTLTALQESIVVQRNLPVFVKIFDRVSAPTWIDLFHAHGKTHFTELFVEVLQVGKATYVQRYLEVVSLLLDLKNNPTDDFVKSELTYLPKGLSLIALDDQKQESLICEIFKSTLSMQHICDENTRQSLSQSFAIPTARKYINRVLTTSLIDLGGFDSNDLAKRLAKYCESDLKARTKDMPIPLPNWSRKVPNSNQYEQIWKILADFLRSETQEVFDYKAVQSARSQMESAIANVTIDLSKTTIAKGSPHTLRLTKTHAEYERTLKKWKEDCDLLVQLSKRIS